MGAEHSLAVANHGPVKDHAPGNKAARKVDEAMELIHPMAEDQFEPQQRLDVEGPYLIDQVETAQSSVTRADGGKISSMECLVPAAVLTPAMPIVVPITIATFL